MICTKNFTLEVVSTPCDAVFSARTWDPPTYVLMGNVTASGSALLNTVTAATANNEPGASQCEFRVDSTPFSTDGAAFDCQMSNEVTVRVGILNLVILTLISSVSGPLYSEYIDDPVGTTVHQFNFPATVPGETFVVQVWTQSGGNGNSLSCTLTFGPLP